MARKTTVGVKVTVEEAAALEFVRRGKGLRGLAGVLRIMSLERAVWLWRHRTQQPAS